MIPKVIHYCWFGRGEKPALAKECIESWKKFLPDYEIKEWNEDNFDVNIISYTADAYKAKKYAFVSDYARFWVLYNYGGIYFDTDVEVIKPFDDIVSKGNFMGCESDGNKETGFFPTVNPGLCIGAEANNKIYKEILDYYATLNFINAVSKKIEGTVVAHTSTILKRHGLKAIKGEQQIYDITIYPKEYFNPYNYTVDRLEKTVNTHSIHWYATSWGSPYALFKLKVGTFIRKHILRKH